MQKQSTWKKNNNQKINKLLSKYVYRTFIASTLFVCVVVLFCFVSFRFVMFCIVLSCFVCLIVFKRLGLLIFFSRRKLRLYEDCSGKNTQTPFWPNWVIGSFKVIIGRKIFWQIFVFGFSDSIMLTDMSPPHLLPVYLNNDTLETQIVTHFPEDFYSNWVSLEGLLEISRAANEHRQPAGGSHS